MQITWLGHASFLVEAAGERLVTDPYDKIGLKFPEVIAEMVTTSHDHFDHAAVNLVGGDPAVVSGPVDKLYGPFQIKGIETFHDESDGSERGKNTVFVIGVEGLRICHLGDLGHQLSKEQVSEIGKIDVMMVPVGGTYTVDAEGAARVVESLKPSIVIPMHYKIDGLQLDIGGVVGFTNRFSNVSEADVLDVNANNLPSETEVVVLKRRS